MLEALAGFARAASPPVFLGVSVAAGILVFSSDNIATALGVDQFRQTHRGELGIAFLVSVSMFLATSVWGISAFIRKTIANRTAGKRKAEAAKAKTEQHQKSLHELTPDEKAYLIPYVLDDQNTQYFRIQDGIAGGLQAKSIIYRASNMGSLVDGWAFNIQPWARDYLKEHQHLLDGANPTPHRSRAW